MILTGEQKIAADRAAVWRVLNDPDVLRQCIPGCQSLERDGEDGFTAIVAIKVGPIGARFSGSVHLMDIDPPNGYRLVGQGNGGAAGSAKGSATVSLRDDGGATVLTYEVETSVGGRIAQLGGAVIDATARQLAGRYFVRFAELAEAAGRPSEEVGGIEGSERIEPSAAAASLGRTEAVPAGRSAILARTIFALLGFAAGLLTAAIEHEWAVLLAIGAVLIVLSLASFEAGRRSARLSGHGS